MIMSRCCLQIIYKLNVDSTIQFSKNNINLTVNGDKRDRTADLLRAKQALSQLSYTPI